MTSPDPLVDELPADSSPSLEFPDRSTLAMFFGVFLVLAALSPLYLRPMGYMEEEFIAAKQMLWRVTGIFTGTEIVGIDWPRHGGLPALLHTPFIAAGRLLFGPALEWQDRLFSMEPVLLTAGIVTLAFHWMRRTRSSARLAFILAIATGFGSLLWPYAYFGMEPAQSFFILLAGYVALVHRRSNWGAVILIALAAGFAAAVKSTGVFLLPALAWAFWVLFREPARRDLRGTLPKVAVALALAGGIVLWSAWTRGLFWSPRGGTEPYLSLWLVRDPITYLINVVSFLTSPNKGLFVFVPLALFAVIQLRGLIRRGSDLAVFASLITAAVAFGFPLFLVWSDETFGPRYFHCAIAPLVLCIAEAYAGRERRLLRHPGFILAAVLGFTIAGLGALFAYGNMQTVATQSGQATLENFQGNLVWNHIRFNARLFRTWVRQDDLALWTPSQRWYFKRPENAPEPLAVDLATAVDVNARRVAVPQAFVVTTWGESHGRILRGTLLVAFVAGIALLLLVYRRSGPLHSEDRLEGLVQQ